MLARAVLECWKNARMNRMRRNDPESGTTRAAIPVAVSSSGRCKWTWWLHCVSLSAAYAEERPEGWEEPGSSA